MTARPDVPGPEAPPAATPRSRGRSRWLLPAMAGVILVGGLVIAGIVPLSAVLYGGLFGAMILMHVGGGHGGHGGHGDHGDHGDHGGPQDGGRHIHGAAADESPPTAVHDEMPSAAGDDPGARRQAHSCH